eukprot:TRINITY_DN3131_c0_g1_i1.p1 TRINITY_DN3131_c0_g1~~TRINITY_DN3131_c0_g1_i1.p1  ORF type:complete len:107 (-),score=13.81 TRINITY_DN3131_c0_g1_i1:20-340(-)
MARQPFLLVFAIILFVLIVESHATTIELVEKSGTDEKYKGAMKEHVKGEKPGRPAQRINPTYDRFQFLEENDAPGDVPGPFDGKYPPIEGTPPGCHNLGCRRRRKF